MGKRTEEVSRVVFGSATRLELLATIAQLPSDEIYPARVAEVADVPAGTVSTYMQKLVKAELLQVLPSKRGDAVKRHARLAANFWEQIALVHQGLAEG